jgi:anaerobic carbon-monoxide dehydrogenase iron sulfur subunit
VPKMIVAQEQFCMACKSCMIECAMAHTQAATLAEAIASGTLEGPRVFVESVRPFGMPLQCRHCQDAPCVTVCPTQAVHRASQESPVLLEKDRCIGCRSCMLVCPFGVIDLSSDGKAVTKCDLCLERTQAGQDPACVAACPTNALRYVEAEEFLRQRRREAAGQIAAGADKARQVAAEDKNGR